MSAKNLYADPIAKYQPFFGYWYIDSFIGEGNYGRVYRIKRENLGKTEYSAIKWIPLPNNESELSRMQQESGFNKERVIERLQKCKTDMENEIELLKEMRHCAHIVGYEDHFVYQRQDEIGYDIVIKMELLTPLLKRLKEPFTVDDVITLGVDICSGLIACKEKKILHRDIKPENMFIDDSGHYRLGDFGVARQLEESLCSSTRGTPIYMAPEVWRGEPYDYNADTYSLALVLYYLLNRFRMPFAPHSSRVLSRREKDEALNKRLEINPKKRERIPAPIDGFKQINRILEKALSYEPTKRYQSAADLQKELLLLQKVKHPKLLNQHLGNAEKAEIPVPQKTPNVIKAEPKRPPKEHGARTNTGKGKQTAKRHPPVPRKKKKSLLLLLLMLLLVLLLVTMIVLITTM